MESVSLKLYFIIEMRELLFVLGLVCARQDATKVCTNAASQKLNDPNGVVESSEGVRDFIFAIYVPRLHPNQSHPYAANEFCYYSVNPGKGPIRIKFTKFDVEDEDPTDNYSRGDDEGRLFINTKQF